METGFEYECCEACERCFCEDEVSTYSDVHQRQKARGARRYCLSKMISESLAEHLKDLSCKSSEWTREAKQMPRSRDKSAVVLMAAKKKIQIDKPSMLHTYRKPPLNLYKNNLQPQSSCFEPHENFVSRTDHRRVRLDCCRPAEV